MLWWNKLVHVTHTKNSHKSKICLKGTFRIKIICLCQPGIFQNYSKFLNGTMTLRIKTFSIMTLSINGMYVTLNISDIQHK